MVPLDFCGKIFDWDYKFFLWDLMQYKEVIFAVFTFVAGLFVISKEGRCLESCLIYFSQREEPQLELLHSLCLSLNLERRANKENKEKTARRSSRLAGQPAALFDDIMTSNTCSCEVQ